MKNSDVKQHYKIPKTIEIYYITNEGLAFINENVLLNDKIMSRYPEINKFKWAHKDDYRVKIAQLITSLPENNSEDIKSVVGIYEDGTIKAFINVDVNFKPSLETKY